MIVPMEAGEITMAMTAANGCARFGSADAGVRFEVTVVLHQDDLGEITRCGYEDAATTDCRRRGEAVVIAVSTVAG